MASAAERLASNFDLSVLGKATELKKRLLFVLGALIVARIGAHIPLPGVDPVVLDQIFRSHSQGILGVFNMFSGGALGRMTIFALAVMPYITSSIIIQFLTMASPQLTAMKKEGEAGRRKINQYTRYATVALAALQGYGLSVGVEGMTSPGGLAAVIDPGLFFRFTATITLVGGTLFLMWLGEQINQRGIGNGISLIIFGGIVAEFPRALANTFELGRKGVLSTEFILLMIIFALALVAFIVFMERAHRRILVQYPKRMVGNKLYAGDSSHIPLKVNTAGVIPPILASSILLFPLTIANFGGANKPEWLTTITAYLQHGEPLYMLLYVAGIIGFSFFYTGVAFNVEETSDNLKKNGGFIAGVRPGKQTADYLSFILNRLTVIGAIYLAFVCVVPEFLVAKFSIPFVLGGTSLLIVVNVMMDFVAQVQSHLFAHQYEGLIRKANLKGKRR